MLEQMLLHKLAIALRMRRSQADILIEIEGRHPRKIEPFFAMASDELAIQAQRRAAGREAQHALGLLFHQTRDKVGRAPCDRLGIGKNNHTHAASSAVKEADSVRRQRKA